MIDAKFCLELISALGLVVVMWIRLERRLTKIEDKVQERYRDKAALRTELDDIKKWLPVEKHGK